MQHDPTWHSERRDHAERQFLHNVRCHLTAKHPNGRAPAEHTTADGTDEVQEAKHIEQDNVCVPTRSAARYGEHHKWRIRTHDEIADPCGPRKCPRQ